MSLEENKELVRRFYREVINEANLDAIDTLLTEDFVHNGEARGRDGQRQACQMFLSAFPDLENTIEQVVAEGDLVVARQTWRGTQKGAFLGVEPTGKQVSFGSCAVLRISDGMIAEAWDTDDLLGLMQQLGALPSG